MKIKILSTESLGSRGLSVAVELGSRKILIDPGIALGWKRYGFLPHPFQVAVGAGNKRKIIKELKDVTDVVFSHFDGDHCPLIDANPYQLSVDEVNDFFKGVRIWAKDCESLSFNKKVRRENLSRLPLVKFLRAEGRKEGPVSFSDSVPHGRDMKKKGGVMMTKIEDQGQIFVHASDIQLLNEGTVKKILEWKPSLVLVSGPPLYLSLSDLPKEQRRFAWHNALELSENVKSLIVDHHVLRNREGIEWLEKLKKVAKNKIFSAASFMKRQPIFLEAWRKDLYKWVPVPDDWHRDYSKGKTSFDDYREKSWETLIKKRKVEPCKWYDFCPIPKLARERKIDKYWVENYCLVGNKNCVRYKQEEKGIPHKRILPNGEKLNGSA